MRITDFLHSSHIIPSLKAVSKQEVLSELVEMITRNDVDADKEDLVRILIEREELGSTGIGEGVAIPHGKCDGISKILAGFGKSDAGVDFNSMDNRPAHLFFVLIAPKNSAGDHLKALSRISRVIKDPILKRSLLHAETTEEIYDLLEESDLRIP